MPRSTRSADLIVLDVMPELDGRRPAPSARSGGAGTPSHHLFLTARDTTADKVEGLRLGSDDYVTAVLDRGEMVERVKAVLRHVGVRAGGAKLTSPTSELEQGTQTCGGREPAGRPDPHRKWLSNHTRTSGRPPPGAHRAARSSSDRVGLHAAGDAHTPCRDHRLLRPEGFDVGRAAAGPHRPRRGLQPPPPA